MGAALRDLRPVHVVGVGLHRYQRGSDTTFVTLGLTAVRGALTDAGLDWPEVEAAYTGTALLGFAVGRTMLRYLGATGIPMVQVENASASGSTAFRMACLDVATGISDIAVAIGVDKPEMPRLAPARAGLRDLVGSRMLPVTHFALLADEYMHRYGVTPEQVALVAVKNHRNGARNPFAHRQKERTLDDVLGEDPLAGVLTRLQCCPIGEGAAAVIVASDSAVERLGLNRSRSVQVLSSVLASERVYPGAANWDAELTRETTACALAEAGIGTADLDVIEVHDAFSIEELIYLEAMGVCGQGEAAALLTDGAWDIGGRCAVSPSGGLLSMGHPIGPTGVGQVVEITRQLRGEAGDRQHPGARTGLAHMVGVGAVCAVHVLRTAE
ncbi:MAG: thiolase family protein [Acidimicrobiia bacterium]|nr:thiolase family protein [Acidimicrobiia bacterium]